ncbi:MAG: hypothetical protein K8T89_09570 [Planctomycetes bacterium]|nr:hypothetical protein [Planctomycetota bacterium]
MAGRSYQSEELACDLPGTEHMRNIGSKLDGYGMCVFTSVEHAARWHGLEQFRGFRDWCAERYPGGGDPDKLDQLLAAYCKAKGIVCPPYIQYEGPDVRPILELCDKTGRMACITYGQSPRYIGPRSPTGTIAHMTNCPKFSGQLAVCLDNNFPGEASYEWMPLAEMERRIKHPRAKNGWVFVWLAPSPPPVPRK